MDPPANPTFLPHGRVNWPRRSIATVCRPDPFMSRQPWTGLAGLASRNRRPAHQSGRRQMKGALQPGQKWFFLIDLDTCRSFQTKRSRQIGESSSPHAQCFD